MKKFNKLIGVGFQKTGTTSLLYALEQLGFHMSNAMTLKTGPKIWNKKNILEVVEKIKDNFDGFIKHPYPSIFKELDKMFPNSKFILTLRNPRNWIKSSLRQFADIYGPLRPFTYGVSDGFPYGHEQEYVDVFNKHNRDVMHYFKDRPDDLLVMNIAEKGKWKLLCDFLGIQKIPDEKFHHIYHLNKVGLLKSKMSEKELYKNLDAVDYGRYLV